MEIEFDALQTKDVAKNLLVMHRLIIDKLESLKRLEVTLDNESLKSYTKQLSDINNTLIPLAFEAIEIQHLFIPMLFKIEHYPTDDPVKAIDYLKEIKELFRPFRDEIFHNLVYKPDIDPEEALEGVTPEVIKRSAHTFALANEMFQKNVPHVVIETSEAKDILEEIMKKAEEIGDTDTVNKIREDLKKMLDC